MAWRGQAGRPIRVAGLLVGLAGAALLLGLACFEREHESAVLREELARSGVEASVSGYRKVAEEGDLRSWEQLRKLGVRLPGGEELEELGMGVELLEGGGRAALGGAVELGAGGLAAALLEAWSRVDGGGDILALAVAGGDVGTVRAIVGALVDLGEEVSLASLLGSAAGGDERILEELWAGADDGVKWTAGMVLLGAAVEDGDGDLVRQLLGLGVSPERAAELDCPPLYRAVALGEIAVVEALLAGGAWVDAECPKEGETSLGLALRTGNREAVQSLLDYCAGGGKVDEASLSPLAWAVARRDIGAVEALVSRGLGVDEGLPGEVPDEFLDLLDHRQLRYYLSRGDRGTTLLMVAAARGHVELVRILLGAGAKTSRYSEKFKRYAINYAADQGYLHVMQLLLGRVPEDEDILHVIVDLSEQRVRVYRGEEEIFSAACSTGRKGFETPAGEYVITNKYRNWNSTLYGSSMPYFMRLNCGDFGLHQGALPGYPASHGCIRLPRGAAEKMFSLCRLGDRVTIR
jgi:ankyrin repeat protein